MRTVTYDYVLQRACELTGRVFSTLTTEESNFFRHFTGFGFWGFSSHYTILPLVLLANSKNSPLT